MASGQTSLTVIAGFSSTIYWGVLDVCKRVYNIMAVRTIIYTESGCNVLIIIT